ncbi:hypothetical protein GCM10027048_42400 [Hymenobacter coalescens]
MKAFALLPLLTALAAPALAQTAPTPAAPTRVVEASCGQCRLGLPGKGCDLAVRLDGRAYFVDGTSIDSHGDAHAKDGFCNAIRRAEVRGQVVDNRFVATHFRLLPDSTATGR